MLMLSCVWAAGIAQRQAWTRVPPYSPSASKLSVSNCGCGGIHLAVTHDDIQHNGPHKLVSLP